MKAHAEARLAERGMLLVICYGNPLCGDDGVGWVIGQRLSEEKLPACVRVVVCHQLTPDLAEPIGLAERVVFVDARLEGCCGSIRCTRLEPSVKAAGPSGHGTKPDTLLGLSRWLYDKTPEALMVSVAGARFKPGEPLSPEVEHVLPTMLSCVRAFLTACEP